MMEDTIKTLLIFERNKIISIIKKDIEFQKSQKSHIFEKDKAVNWRIEGMEFIVKKIENLNKLDAQQKDGE